MRRRSIALVALVILGSAFAAAAGARPAEHDAPVDVYMRGRALSQWLLAGELDRVYDRMSPQLQRAAGGRDGLARLMTRVAAKAGEESAVQREAAYHEQGLVHYYRISRFSNLLNGTMTLHWVWQPHGDVVGATIAPTPTPAPSESLDHRTKTSLHLPVTGVWYVRWGGRLPHQNHHVVAADQRFAYDFLILRDGHSYTASGTANEDYFCFGKPILAPAGGVVVQAIDGVADNQPGVMNEAAPAGNHVVIDHRDGEYSLLAHLRRGTVAVETGDEVAAGERLGECGNSGRSSEPHLHYHLQTGPAFGQGVGLPAQFNDWFSGRQYRARGEPVRGELVHRIAPDR